MQSRDGMGGEGGWRGVESRGGEGMERGCTVQAAARRWPPKELPARGPWAPWGLPPSPAHCGPEAARAERHAGELAPDLEPEIRTAPLRLLTTWFSSVLLPELWGPMMATTCAIVPGDGSGGPNKALTIPIVRHSARSLTW
jgi:hypothetical protein